jgi:hypothetical protein
MAASSFLNGGNRAAAFIVYIVTPNDWRVLWVGDDGDDGDDGLPTHYIPVLGVYAPLPIPIDPPLFLSNDNRGKMIVTIVTTHISYCKSMC